MAITAAPAAYATVAAACDLERPSKFAAGREIAAPTAAPAKTQATTHPFSMADMPHFASILGKLPALHVEGVLAGVVKFRGKWME